MFKLKEIQQIFIAIIFIFFSISLFRKISLLPYLFIFSFLIIFVNLIGKKIASFYFDSEIEIKIWEIQRYGFRPKDYLKKPFKLGIFLPLITSIIFLGKIGSFVWLAPLIFNIKPTIQKTARRHGLYTYSEITEDQMGLIAAIGIFANLFFAIIGYLIGSPEFSRLNIYFAFFNLIPISNLDGNKIFFGNFILWAFLSIITLIGLVYSIILI